MTLCNRCDRIVTADTVCSIVDCPHKDATLRTAAIVSAPDSSGKKKPAGIATVTFDDTPEPSATQTASPDGTTCPACGTLNMRGAKFCAGCGTALGSRTSDPASTSALVPTTDESAKPTRSEKQIRTIGFAAAAFLILGLLGYLAFGQGGNNRTSPNAAGSAIVEAAPAEPLGQERSMWVVADANIRDRATAKGSALLGKLPRATQINGVMQIGEDGRTQWFRLVDGRGFIGAVNLSQTETPRLAKMLGDQSWYAPDDVAILALPDSNSPKIATLTPGQMVKLAGITENGFAEAKLGKGGVGFIASDSYDFSISTRVLLSGDVQAFYAMLGMANGSLANDYTGLASDQSIRLTIWSPYSSENHGLATYTNTTSGRSCVMKVRLLGRETNGRFRLIQSSDNSGTPCKLTPDLILETNGDVLDAWWKQGDQTYMSAKLQTY